MHRLCVTVEIDEVRNTYWLRFNKGDADNAAFIWNRGPREAHGVPVVLQGSKTRFRVWWKSTDSKPYLQAEKDGSWSFDEAYHEVKRVTGLAMDNPPRKPDKVEFDLGYHLTP